ncbi:hypothetical protein [Streptomyces sp. AHA2]|uniref:hypothetical protein n=1 Tax=Streptomyces sp. AHA2 TaxID=3064526 RepID=UPI002FE2352F
MKLTKTQAAALETIKRNGVLYAYNGVSRATIAVLEREGLVTVEWTLRDEYTYRTRRHRVIADWVARPATPTN